MPLYVFAEFVDRIDRICIYPSLPYLDDPCLLVLQSLLPCVNTSKYNPSHYIYIHILIIHINSYLGTLGLGIRCGVGQFTHDGSQHL